MDKLKPILAHKFWILSAVAVIVPLVGWYLGTSAQAEAIDARITKINGLNPSDGATTPNDDWIAKIGVVKVDREKKVQSAADFLWSQQRDDMVWPSQMRPFVQGVPFESDLPIEALQTYRRIFDTEVEKLRRIVDPYDWNERRNRFEGAVVLDRATLPLTDPATWQGGPPKSKEVWYLQEDVWLLGALLRPVREVNDRAGAESNIIKAPIKQITQIELRGGDRAALAASASGTDPMSMDPSMDPSMGGEYMPADAGMYGGGMPGMEGAGGAMAAGGALDFDMDEEVGPATPVAASSSGDMSMDMSAEAGGGELYAPPGMDAGFGMSGMGGSGNPLLDQKRYVDDAPELPYKTRAFKMTVVMDHRQIPEFLVHLTNSPFPVNIERVHWTELNPSTVYPTNTGGYGGGMPGMEGYAPPDAAGMGSGFGSRRPSPMMGTSRPNTPSPMSGMGLSRPGAPSRPGPGMSTPRSPMTPGVGRGMSRGGMGMSTPGGYGMEGMDPMGMGSGYGSQGADPYSQAMADPYLAQVVVGGVMTIYRSPQDVQAAIEGAADAGGAADAAAAGMMPGAAPGAAGLAPAAPGAIPAGETPVDPAAVGATELNGGAAPADPAVPADPAGTPPEGVSPEMEATTPGDANAAPPAAEEADLEVEAAASDDASTPTTPPAVDFSSGPPQ